MVVAFAEGVRWTLAGLRQKSLSFAAPAFTVLRLFLPGLLVYVRLRPAWLETHLWRANPPIIALPHSPVKRMLKT